jgi:Mce-associated membrane protein
MATDETTLPEYQAPPSESRRLLRFSPQVLWIVIFVAILIATNVLQARLNSDDGRTEVFQTAQRFLVLLTTYNGDTLNRQREQVLAMSVGKFRDDYSTLTDSAFLKALQDRQADSKGRVVKLAVTSLDGDEAEAFALVEVTTKNKDLPTPRVEENAIELSLVRASGGWRIDAVTILGTLR